MVIKAKYYNHVKTTQYKTFFKCPPSALNLFVKNRKISPSYDSYLNAIHFEHCIPLYKIFYSILYYLNFILGIVF